MLSKAQLNAGVRDLNDPNWQRPTYPFEFERQDGDYMIQLTFSELIDATTCSVSPGSSSTANSNWITIKNVCDVFINDFTFVGSFCDSNPEVQAINHRFEISYATSHYCEFTVAEVTIPEISQTF